MKKHQTAALGISVVILAAVTVIFFLRNGRTDHYDVVYADTVKDETAQDAEEEDAHTAADNLPDTMIGAEAEAEPVPTEAEAEEKSILPEYEEILKINPFVAGFLKMEGAGIVEMVVYTPRSQNYFLHRDLDGSYSEAGSLFIANLWREEYNNTLIYGHNMKSGLKFGNLKKYADETFGKENSVIRFDTLYEEREYELAAVFYSQIDEDEIDTDEEQEEEEELLLREAVEDLESKGINKEKDELLLKDMPLGGEVPDTDIYRAEKDADAGRFRYYYYTDLSDRSDFEYFAENVKERAIYDTGTNILWGDELLTLSTCSYHVRNGRLIVVFKRVK